uniref:Uncharacterized protein n=1 Tax=Timema bartmani TaxID=61472 RepID=A0A7R9F9M4_9NEOP|nr:unnamed protein product [Timema bartmani]
MRGEARSAVGEEEEAEINPVSWVSYYCFQPVSWVSYYCFQPVAWVSYYCFQPVYWVSYYCFQPVAWVSYYCFQPVSWVSYYCFQPVAWVSYYCFQPVSWLSYNCFQPVSWLSYNCFQPVSRLSYNCFQPVPGSVTTVSNLCLDKSDPPAATLLREESVQEQESGVIVFDELGGNVWIKTFNAHARERSDKDVVQHTCQGTFGQSSCSTSAQGIALTIALDLVVSAFMGGARFMHLNDIALARKAKGPGFNSLVQAMQELGLMKIMTPRRTVYGLVMFGKMPKFPRKVRKKFAKTSESKFRTHCLNGTTPSKVLARSDLTMSKQHRGDNSVLGMH